MASRAAGRLIAGVIAATLAAAPCSAAGKLDLDVFKAQPDPTMALAYGIFMPGGGWFYQDATGTGAFYLAITAALVVGTASAARSGDGLLAAAAGSGLLIVRFADLTGSVANAKRDQLDEIQRLSQPPPGY